MIAEAIRTESFRARSLDDETSSEPISIPLPLVEAGIPHHLQGLSQDEVEERRSLGLGNRVIFKTSRTFGEILGENLITFFNMVLLALGVLLVLFGSYVEALITSGMLLINVIIATGQEVRAKRQLDDIALLTRPKATVIRQGMQQEVDPDEIVVDDLLCISPGDQVVVDGTVISQDRIDVDESLLTGESKSAAKFEGDKIFSGSFCVTGEAVYKASGVGVRSFANKLALEARIYSRHLTPLQREVNFSIRILLALVVFFAILLAISNFLNHVPLVESLQSASVLFGLAPSSLFLMIVVAYAVAAVRISNKGALVQQANSVESLCNVNILCLDKTGTLTTNRIKLKKIYPYNGDKKRLVGPHSEEALNCLLGDFCASGSVRNRTAEAILRECGGTRRQLSEEIPFSSEQGWSALVFDGHKYTGTYVLGAPEILFPNLVKPHEIAEKNESVSAQGQRVLLFAYHPQPQPLRTYGDRPILPKNLEPLCLLNLSDELRPKVRETLKGFVDAGIKLKFISGDNPNTVAALVKQAGFDKLDPSLTPISGLELAKMNEVQFAQTAAKANVFGRITPRQKEKLIDSLVEQGHYVAMTGDGLNDILALKRANIGIAMQSGSQATRNVADIVLLEDSFGVLPEAFQEGQRILNGMQDILRLYMSRILVLAILIAAIGFASDGFPITPRQNAVISFLTLSIPALCLAIWAKPRQIPRVNLGRTLAHFVIPAVITIGMVGFGVYLFSLIKTGDHSYAQTTLTYVTIICGILLIIFVEPPTKWWAGGDILSGDLRPTLLSIGLLALFFVFLAIPSLRDFYGLTLLRHPSHYVVIGLAVVFWLFTLRFIWRSRLVERYLNLDVVWDPQRT